MLSTETIQSTNLVARLQARDRAAFSEFFDRYGHGVYRVCYGIMGNAQDAEDLTHEAFLKALREIGSLRDAEQVKAWLYRLARNLCLDELRRRKPRARMIEMDADDPDGNPEGSWLEDPYPMARPERVYQANETRVTVTHIVNALPPAYRIVLTLREIEEQSYQEIAEAMNITVPAVHALLHRARGKFREQYLTQQLPPAPRECAPFAPHLPALYDHALPPKRRARVSAHVARCQHCQASLHEMQETTRAYRAILPLVPPVALKTTLLASLGLTAVAAPAATLSVSTLVATALVVVGIGGSTAAIATGAVSLPVNVSVRAAPIQTNTIQVVYATSFPAATSLASEYTPASITPAPHNTDAPTPRSTNTFAAHNTGTPNARVTDHSAEITTTPRLTRTRVAERTPFMNRTAEARPTREITRMRATEHPTRERPTEAPTREPRATRSDPPAPRATRERPSPPPKPTRDPPGPHPTRNR